MDEPINLDQFELNLQKIVEDRTLLSVTRLLATTLLSNPYMSVGDFVTSLSDDDLSKLQDIGDQMEEDNDVEMFSKIPHLHELILITEMLVRAEGLFSVGIDELTGRVNALCMFLACESLSRKGLVKLHHHNMSFGEDMGEKIVVEKIDGINLDDYI